jgi:MFS superfamily sulfate permease-like transporter
LLFLTGPLKDLPKPGLGAVLVVAAVGLFEVADLRHLWRVSRPELALAVVTMFGVIALDVLDGILLAIGLSLVLVIVRTSRPFDAILGSTGGLTGFHSVADYPDAKTIPGLILYRFGSAVMFFNAPYFSQRALELVAARPDAKWLIVDGGPINAIDSTGAAALEGLVRQLNKRGVRLGLANARTNVRGVLDRAGVTTAMGEGAMFPSLEAAVSAFHGEVGSLPNARN